MKSYDPSQVVLTIGSILVTGFAKGTMITVEHDVDSYELEVGSDGEGCRTKSANRAGRIKFRLMQSADCNSQLSALHVADRATGSGLVPAGVKDLSGSSLAGCEQGYLERIPTAEFSDTLGEREWSFRTDVLINFVGGNN